jgi:hypothetical protein
LVSIVPRIAIVAIVSARSVTTEGRGRKWESGQRS